MSPPNLDYYTSNPLSFYAKTAGKNGELKKWKLSLTPPNPSEEKWANAFGETEPNRSSYWLIRCDENLILGHNDVWSDSAMQIYAALYRFAEWTRLPGNQSQAKTILDSYWK